MKTKTLNKIAMIKNINGLSEGDRAFCGPYGVVTCIKSATHCIIASDGTLIPQTIRGARRFKVQNSSKIPNGRNYSMKCLRKAINA